MTPEHQKQENDRQLKQLQLDGHKSAKERNRLGQFATPFELAVEIMEEVASCWERREEKVRFLDPAFGSGAFLSALHAVFEPRSLETATGVEIDLEFARLARKLWGAAPYSAQVIEADFTKLPPPSPANQANLIVCNPPYIRHHHLSQEKKAALKSRVQQAVGLNISSLAGMYCYFLLLSHQWLAPGGVGAWLIPTEFMDVNYGSAIRSYLTLKVTLKRLHRFEPDDVQFADALVSSAVVIFENNPPAADSKATLTEGGTLSAPKNSQDVPFQRLIKSNKWSQLFKTPSVLSSTTDLVFGSLFSTRRGIATGANNFFIMTREEARERKLPEAFLKPILPSPRYLTDDVIYADAEGYPVLAKQLVLLSCSLPEEDIREDYPDLWSYLEEGKKLGIDQRYLSSKRNPWYRQEHVESSPFLCTYMGRSNSPNTPFRFIWNQSQALVPNVYLLVYPRSELAAFLGERREKQALVFEILRQIVVDDIVNAGRTYGGGLHKIEPRELYRVSLSHISAAQELASAMMLF